MGCKAKILEQKCIKCKQVKPRSEFGIRQGGALDKFCLECREIKGYKKNKPREKKEYACKTYGLSPYELLAAKIIELAVEDLGFLKKHNLEHKSFNGIPVSRAGLYRFFNNEYYYLTSVDAEYVLRKAE